MSNFTVRRAKPILGTIVEIGAVGANQEYLQLAVSQAFESIYRVEKLMSYFDQNSDVSCLNHRAWLQPLQVHAWTYAVIEFAKQLSSLSYGLFDISKVRTTHNTVPGKTSFKGSYFDIQLLGDNYVAFANPITIDLGGIAKGFAVDKAIDVLEEYKIESATVNAGGDMRVIGVKPITVCIRDPIEPRRDFKQVELHNAALATSANYYRRNNDRKGIINPLTAQSWLADASVTVVARECMVADALTKIVALNPCGAQRILDIYGAEIIENGRFEQYDAACR